MVLSDRWNDIVFDKGCLSLAASEWPL